MSELRECPFCGDSTDGPTYLDARVAVRCKCGAKGPGIWTGGPNPTREKLNEVDAEAIEAWNRRTPAPVRAEGEATLRETLERVMNQTEADLAAAHAEICKLQGLDPVSHTWPEWSSPANTLRWFETIRAALKAEDSL